MNPEYGRPRAVDIRRTRQAKNLYPQFYSRDEHQKTPPSPGAPPRLRQRNIVPERMRQTLKHHHRRLHARLIKVPLQNRSPAQQHVPRTGDKQRRRKPMHIRKHRRQHRIPRLRRPKYSASWTSPITGGSRCPDNPFSAYIACESPSPAEISHPGKHAQAPPAAAIPSCFSFTATSAVRIAPAEVPYNPIFFGS